MGRKPTKHSPKKQSFFKVLLGDFSKHLCIPPTFTKNHIRQSLSKCGLRGPSGQRWSVELEKTENGCLFFHNDGWQTFVKDHLLQEGDFLMFHFDGRATFHVTVYDKTCCERDVEVPKRRRGRPAKANQGNPSQVKAPEVTDLEGESYNSNVENKTSTGGRRSGNYFMPGKEIRIDSIEGVTQTSTGSCFWFKLKNSCWKLTLKRNDHKYLVALPKEAAIAEGLMNKKSVEIQDPTGRSWPVKLVTVTCKQQNRHSYDRLDISTGWSKCCKANEISVGDTVIFEFVKQGVVRIHIFGKELGRI